MLRRALFVLLPESGPITALPQVAPSLGLSKRGLCKELSQQASTLTSTITEEFGRDPEQAAASIAALPEAVRVKVFQAITQDMAAPGNVKYVSRLLRTADHNNDGVLQLGEFEAALKAHAHASQGQQAVAEAISKKPPLTREQLTRVFTASAIPFVGFGFLDNLIMIVAGDYIDASLGTAFCLSTMAAAGLGNLISDIAGIFCADSIESRARVFKYGRMPKFSTAQAQSPPVSYAKSFGAVLGISVGCILGMFPLLFSHHPHAGPCPDTDRPSPADAASEAAPAGIPAV